MQATIQVQSNRAGVSVPGPKARTQETVDKSFQDVMQSVQGTKDRQPEKPVPDKARTETRENAAAETPEADAVRRESGQADAGRIENPGEAQEQTGEIPQDMQGVLERLLGALADEQDLSQMLESLKKLLDEDGQQKAVSMLAELLNANPGILPPELANQAQEALRTLAAPEDMAAVFPQQEQPVSPEMLETLENLASALKTRPEAQQKLVNALQQLAREPLSAERRTQDGVVVIEKAVSGRQTAQTAAAQIQAENPSAVKTEDPLGAQTKFLRAVAQARSQLQQTGGKAEEPLDIDALQKQVDAGSFLRTSSYFTQAMRGVSEGFFVDPAQLVEQVRTGILTELQAGKSEFIMKLNPAGLGELTVRLVENGAKMTLSILASNQETQRVLSAELGNLREVMKPLNVEVAPMEQKGGEMENQSFAQQNFGEHRHGGEFSRREESFYEYGQAQNADSEPEAADYRAAWTAVPLSGLNAYI